MKGLGTAASRLTAYVFLGLLALVSLLPFYTSLVSATLGNATGQITFLPDRYLVRNFTELFFRVPDDFSFSRAFGNSFTIALSTTLLTGYFGLFTAYGFALFSFRGKKALWALLLALMMVPQTVSLLGFYQLSISLNMIDTFWPLILPGIANSYVVFYLRQYLTTMVPLSLLEAARLDGAGEMAIFHRLILPNILPGMAPILIIVFLQSWNSYLVPLLVLNDDQLRTLPLLLGLLNGSPFGALAASFSMMTMVLLVILLLRFFKNADTREGTHG